MGKFELLVACRRFEVMYSSSWSGRKTQASWKNGLLEDPDVERRRECVGNCPTSSPKEGSYCTRLTWSAGLEDVLEGLYQSCP